MMWARTMRLLLPMFKMGELLVSTSMARMVRDRDEYRRLAPPRPLAILQALFDIITSFASPIAVIVVLFTSKKELPPVPLRLWVIGYAIQSIAHVACVWLQYQPWRWPWLLSKVSVNSLHRGTDIYYLIWWTVGVLMMFKASRNEPKIDTVAPQLAWLTAILLAFEIFIFLSIIITVLAVFVIVGCCMPIIHGVLHLVGEDQDPQGRQTDEKHIPSCPFCDCAVFKVEFAIVQLNVL